MISFLMCHDVTPMVECRKQQKLIGRKVLRFDRICENVEKAFIIISMA